MKKLFVIWLMVVVVFMFASCGTVPKAYEQQDKKEMESTPAVEKKVVKKSNIAWWDNEKVALEEAKKSGLPIYILFTNDENCSYCDRVENELLTNVKVMNILNEKFISVKLDIYDEDNNIYDEDTIRKYNVHAYPTHWFVKHNGEAIGHVKGFVTAEKFIKILEKVVEMNKKE